jgi:hypothetical protein
VAHLGVGGEPVKLLPEATKFADSLLRSYWQREEHGVLVG